MPLPFRQKAANQLRPTCFAGRQKKAKVRCWASGVVVMVVDLGIGNE